MPRRPTNGRKPSRSSVDKSPVVRCAIYTRKSSSEGLDQSFNTLEAQREAAEAYVASQKHAGWTLVSQNYDDGGFSGGNIERPGLKQLIDDCEAGTIDCVIVYKVDRLSRSLMDFARMMQIFEERNIHFVIVTQHFNTAESMGRLTLNILLSFAQFEREIIGERIRDKIAASRKRGKWPGGNLILGYDLDRESRRLVVNEEESGQVREMFRLYLAHESILPVVDIANEKGWATKSWIDRNGKRQGGRRFDRWNLYLLLNNVTYLGKVRHKEDVYEGEHEAIVDRETFEAVRELMDRNRRSRGSRLRNKYGALLCGMLRCGHCEKAMIHCPVKKKQSKVYRYYVCIRAQTAGTDACPSGWVNAQRLEAAVVEKLEIIKGQLDEEPMRGAVERAHTILSGDADSDSKIKALNGIVEQVVYNPESRSIRISIRDTLANGNPQLGTSFDNPSNPNIDDESQSTSLTQPKPRNSNATSAPNDSITPNTPCILNAPDTCNTPDTHNTLDTDYTPNLPISVATPNPHHPETQPHARV